MLPAYTPGVTRRATGRGAAERVRLGRGTASAGEEAGRFARPSGTLPLERALSRYGVASRAEARRLVKLGRVTVDGRTVRDPLLAVVPESVRIAVDGAAVGPPPPRRVVLLHKPRGRVTTRRDPEGRPTVFELLGDEARGLVAVGRLDLATSGLLLLTTDRFLADRLADPASAVPRVYLVTVRGEVPDEAADRLVGGLDDDGETLAASSVVVRKRSHRESHLVVTLVEGKNREIRRMAAAIGHPVTRLRRVSFGGVELGDLPPGSWREATAGELERLLAAAPFRTPARTASPRAPGGPGPGRRSG